MEYILVIDDNIQYLDIIANIINSKFPHINVLKCSTDQLNVARQTRASLFFIDIDMGDVNGIDVAREIKQLYPYNHVIFISAHNDFIHNSLLIQPFYFIRKDHLYEDFNTLWDLLELSGFTKKIFINTADKNTICIKIDDIVYIESQNHVITIHTTSKDYKTYEPLHKLSKQFENSNLCQLHKSFFVNIAMVLTVSSNHCCLNKNISIPIGRKYRKNFISKYKEML